MLKMVSDIFCNTGRIFRTTIVSKLFVGRDHLVPCSNCIIWKAFSWRWLFLLARSRKSRTVYSSINRLSVAFCIPASFLGFTKEHTARKTKRKLIVNRVEYMVGQVLEAKHEKFVLLILCKTPTAYMVGMEKGISRSEMMDKERFPLVGDMLSVLHMFFDKFANYVHFQGNGKDVISFLDTWAPVISCTRVLYLSSDLINVPKLTFQ